MPYAAGYWRDGRNDVWPMFDDEPEHDIDGECWCEPETEHVDGSGTLFIHRRIQ
jgi:hypothetical protein